MDDFCLICGIVVRQLQNNSSGLQDSRNLKDSAPMTSVTVAQTCNNTRHHLSVESSRMNARGTRNWCHLLLALNFSKMNFHSQ